DFAAHAEISEHAFQRPRIGLQLRLAERLTICRLRRAEHVDRWQFELAAFPGGLPGCGLLARRARGRLLILLVFFLVLGLVVLIFVEIVMRRHKRRRAALATE